MYVHEFEKEFWHINYLSGGYLTPPSLDFYFVVGGKHGLVKFRDDQWWSFPWPEEGDLDTFQCPMSPVLHWSLSQPLLGPNMKSIILHQSNYCHPQATTFLTLSPLNATNHRNIWNPSQQCRTFDNWMGSEMWNVPGSDQADIEILSPVYWGY